MPIPEVVDRVHTAPVARVADQVHLRSRNKREALGTDGWLLLEEVLHRKIV
jgi:hypothetical protein